MSSDPNIIKDIRQQYIDKRLVHERNFEAKRLDILKSDPEIAQIEAELNAIGISIARAILEKKDAKQRVQDIKEKSIKLQSRRAERLTELGYSFDYLSLKPLCTACNDSGFLLDQPCECMKKEIRIRHADKIKRLIGDRSRTFKNIDLSLFSNDKTINKNGMSPSDIYEYIADECQKYSEIFGKCFKNILISGPPNSGKTFLAACIADLLVDNDYWVEYETAFNITRSFERDRFNRSSDREKGETDEAEQTKWQSCDLLIIDNLGAEIVSPYTTAALYNLLEERNAASRPVMLISMMNLNDFEERYGAYVFSFIKNRYEKYETAGGIIAV